VRSSLRIDAIPSLSTPMYLWRGEGGTRDVSILDAGILLIRKSRPENTMLNIGASQKFVS